MDMIYDLENISYLQNINIFKTKTRLSTQMT